VALLAMMGLAVSVEVLSQTRTAVAQTLAPGPGVEMATPVLRVADFLDTVGVGTHIDYTNSRYADIGAVIKALRYLGVTRLRDHAPDPGSDPVGQRHLHMAAGAGMRFVFVSRAPKPEQAVQRLREFVAAHPGAIIAVEGPNEVNNWPITFNGQTGTPAAQAYQRTLYNLVKAEPALSNVPVLGFTDWPVHSGVADWNNLHSYAKSGDQPYATIVVNKLNQESVDPDRPFAITETGYHTSLTAGATGGWDGVDPETQAKFILNTYMDAAKLGSRGTFIYQLLDAYADSAGSDMEGHFGLFSLTYEPKPAATAIRNMMTILQDSGAQAGSFETRALPATVVGLPKTGSVLPMQKSSGAYTLVLWDEPDIWDERANRPIVVASRKVNIDLGMPFGTVKVFDPLVSADPVEEFANAQQFDVDVSDHPIIIETSPHPGMKSE